MHLSLGDVGFLFLPGELRPSWCVGLPRDYDRNPEKYVAQDPADHPLGADYTFPGYLLNLVRERQTFMVGLGGDELGYSCRSATSATSASAYLLGGEGTCQAAYERVHRPSRRDRRRPLQPHRRRTAARRTPTG